MKIKGFFFDIDDTITETRSLYKNAIGKCTETFNKHTGLTYSQKEFQELYDNARDKAKALVPTSAAKHNRAIYFQRLVEDLPFQTDFELIYKLYTTYYDHVTPGHETSNWSFGTFSVA